MKKRVLAGIMMAVMMMASVMSVSAANSRTDEVYSSGSSAQAYAVEAGDQSLKESAKAAMTAGKQFITTTAIYNVKEASSGSATANGNGKFDVELTVASLTSSCSDVEVLCYVDGAWQKATVVNVDYNKKTVVVELPKLGPIAVAANVASGGSTGTSPSTGVASPTWLICLAAAFVAVGVVALKKSRS